MICKLIEKHKVVFLYTALFCSAVDISVRLFVLCLFERSNSNLILLHNDQIQYNTIIRTNNVGCLDVKMLHAKFQGPVTLCEWREVRLACGHHVSLILCLP
jgi:hypothetical protein